MYACLSTQLFASFAMPHVLDHTPFVTEFCGCWQASKQASKASDCVGAGSRLLNQISHRWKTSFSFFIYAHSRRRSNITLQTNLVITLSRRLHILRHIFHSLTAYYFCLNRLSKEHNKILLARIQAVSAGNLIMYKN